MVSLDTLSTMTDERKVRLQADLRQGQKHDFFGTAVILNTQQPPVVRVKLIGKAGQERPSARNMDPEGRFFIRLGIGFRAATVKMRMYKIESDDQVIFEPVEIEQEEQNRAFFRVQTSFETKIIPGPGSTSARKYQVGEVKDISGGGLRILTDKYFEPGTVLDLEFALDVHGQQRIVYCSAMVVRCLFFKNARHEIAVEFMDLAEEQRDFIMAYCFAQQRELLRENVQVKDL